MYHRKEGYRRKEGRMEERMEGRIEGGMEGRAPKKRRKDGWVDGG
jgi:hypothetical protein